MPFFTTHPPTSVPALPINPAPQPNRTKRRHVIIVESIRCRHGHHHETQIHPRATRLVALGEAAAAAAAARRLYILTFYSPPAVHLVLSCPVSSRLFSGRPADRSLSTTIFHFHPRTPSPSSGRDPRPSSLPASVAHPPPVGVVLSPHDKV
ncbi:hypothetical protein BKA80DRAFT_277904 [Phyllosticta citrichinensis]